MNFLKKYNSLFVLIFFVSNVVVAAENEVLSGSASPRLTQAVPVGQGILFEHAPLEISEISKFYQEKFARPRDMDPTIFHKLVDMSVRIMSENKKNSELDEACKKDCAEVVSEFGLSVQNQINRLIPSFGQPSPIGVSLEGLDQYQSVCNKLKLKNKLLRDTIFTDNFLNVASFVFHNIPNSQDQKNIEETIAAILQNFHRMMIEIEPSLVDKKNPCGRKKTLNHFLSIFETLFKQEAFKNLYHIQKLGTYVYMETDEKTLDAFKDQISNLYKKDCSIKTQMQTFVKEQKFEQDKKELDLLRNKSMQIEQQILEILQKQHERERELARNGLLPDEIWNKLNEEEKALMKELYEEQDRNFLQLEMQRNEHQEFLEKLKKMEAESDKKYKELLDVEQKNHSKLLTNYRDEYLRCRQKIEKRKLENISCAAYQILQDRERLLEAYEKKMQVCEQEFIAKLNEDLVHADVCAKNRHIFQTIENHKNRRIQNALKLEQKDLLWTKIHEDGKQFIAEREALEFDKIVQDEKYEKVVAKIQEKNRISLGVVQRFMQLMLQKQRTARKEIKEIKEKKTVEELQNLQSRSDLESLPFSLPYLSQSKTARPAHLVGIAVPEIHEVVAPQPVVSINSHLPRPTYLARNAVPEQRAVDQGQVAVDLEQNPSPGRHACPYGQNLHSLATRGFGEVDSGWFACADGFELKDCGNGWAQDEQGYWYVYNSITNYWDAYENPLPPTYEQTTSDGVIVDPRLLQ
jgi:hypothetical protein